MRSLGIGQSDFRWPVAWNVLAFFANLSELSRSTCTNCTCITHYSISPHLLFFLKAIACIQQTTWYTNYLNITLHTQIGFKKVNCHEKVEWIYSTLSITRHPQNCGKSDELVEGLYFKYICVWKIMGQEIADELNKLTSFSMKNYRVNTVSCPINWTRVI